MNSSIPPWAASAFELLVHAEGHYRESGDIDRRLAVIGFDNAIESAITTYLSLKPIQRDGREYDGKDVQTWLRDHTTKLAFFYEELDRRKQTHLASEAELRWFHQVRNEVYHSGIGGLPNEHCLRGIREAAMWVFSVLFEVLDVEIQVFEAVETLKPYPNALLDEYLADSEPPVRLAGMTFPPGEVLIAVAPAVYRQMTTEVTDLVAMDEAEDG
jgi:hypothetical protein